MRKFNCTNWEKVNEWVLNNVEGDNEKFTQILKNTYYNFILDIADGVPFEYTKKSMYGVNNAVYIYTDKKMECDFCLYILPLNIKLAMSFNQLGKNGVFDADKLIEFIKMAYKFGKLRKEEQDVIMCFLNSIDEQEE